jgi:hypothetical protein
LAAILKANKAVFAVPFSIVVFPFSKYASELEYRWNTRRGTDGQRMAGPAFILDENPVNFACAN